MPLIDHPRPSQPLGESHGLQRVSKSERLTMFDIGLQSEAREARPLKLQSGTKRSSLKRRATHGTQGEKVPAVPDRHEARHLGFTAADSGRWSVQQRRKSQDADKFMR